jgi:nucleotide-binding universal stress UspA family protein
MMPEPPGPSGVPAPSGGPPPPPQLIPRILLALDAGTPSPRLAGFLPGLVGLLRSDVVICHVVMRPTSVAGNELDGSPANPAETAILSNLRAAAVAWFGEQGADMPIKILHGDPGQRICEYASFSDCALIILGPREKPSVAKRLRGSVSKYVLSNSRRSVLVIGD